MTGLTATATATAAGAGSEFANVVTGIAMVSMAVFIVAAFLKKNIKQGAWIAATFAVAMLSLVATQEPEPTTGSVAGAQATTDSSSAAAVSTEIPSP